MATTKRTPRDLDERTLLKLADYLLKSVPGREGVLAVQGGQRVRTFRGEGTRRLCAADHSGAPFSRIWRSCGAPYLRYYGSPSLRAVRSGRTTLPLEKAVLYKEAEEHRRGRLAPASTTRRA
jgi:hypothetical protein